MGDKPKAELPPPPKWMVEALLAKPRFVAKWRQTSRPPSGDRVLDKALQDIRTLRDGRPCNEILNACAFAVGRAVGAGVLDDTVLESLLEAAQSRCTSNHRSSITSGFRTGVAKAGRAAA